MAQASEQSEPNKNANPVPVAGNTTEAKAKTGNLAFTNPDEYKHKHGEHKDGEHRHHHHHHHHHHRHFHLLSLSPSGIRDNLKLLFKSVYTYPYMLLFLSLVFLFFMNSGLALKLLDVRKTGFSTLETYYQWQEYLVMNKAVLIRIPFQITLLVSVGITIFLMQQQERHWQRNVLKLLPALGAAAVFSFPFGGDREIIEEEHARSACRDCMINYYDTCMKFAGRHDGAFPKRLPRMPSIASKYSSDHYIYYGSGKKVNDELFILIEDKQNNHTGNYRYALRNDGMILVSKYGGRYEEYKSALIQKQTEDEEDEFDFLDDDLDEEKMSKEPFYSFYRNKNLSIAVMEGTVRDASLIPDPQKNDYPDACYSLMVEVNSFSFSNNPNKKISQELILNVPILKDMKILQNNVFRHGDRIAWTCAPYDDMPDRVKELQVSDDYQSFEHDYYFALTVEKINTFSNNGSKQFSKRQITVLPVNSLEKNEIASKKRSDRIQSEIKRIEDELKKHGGTFENWKEEYSPVGKEYKQLVKKRYEGWTENSYFAASGDETSFNNTQSFIDTILPYKKYLEDNNIDLILLRVPSKNDYAARVLTKKEFYENPDWIEFLYTCLKNDLEIIDPMEDMWKHRFDYPLFYYYNYNSSDMHPFEGAFNTIAKCVSDVLKRYDYRTLPKKDALCLQKTVVNKTNQQFFWPKGNDTFNSREHLSFMEVQLHEQPIDIQTNTGSPFLFLSNSFGGRFPVPTLSIPDYTAYFLQHLPDWSFQVSLQNGMLRNLVVYPERLSKRSCVIMICTPSMFNRPFPSFPKYIADGAHSVTLEDTISFLSDDVEIIDEDHLYSIVEEKNGCLSVKLNPGVAGSSEKAFYMTFTIPAVEDKSTCMLRVNFANSEVCNLSAIDYDTSTVIESNCEPPRGKDQHADLFVPVLNNDRKIKLKLSCVDPQVLSNMELWYY